MSALLQRLRQGLRLAHLSLALTSLALLLAVPSAVRLAADLAPGLQPDDFAVYYLGAAMLNTGQPDLYSPERLPALASAHGVERYAPPYCYPPAFAGVLRPLARLPYPAAAACWLALNTICLALSAHLLVGLAGLPPSLPALAVGGALVGLFPPVHQAVRLGQVSPLLLLLATGALYVLLVWPRRQGRQAEALAGSLLAAATMVKVFPGLLLAYVLLVRRWRLAAFALGALSLCLALGVAWGGGLGNTVHYVSAVLPSLNGQRMAILQPDNQSLSAFFMRLFTTATFWLPLPGREGLQTIRLRPLANSPGTAVAFTYLASALLLACAAAVGLRALPDAGERWAAGFGLTLIASLLIVSCTYYHGLVLLLLPLALLVRLGRHPARPGLLAVASGAYLLVVVQRYANWLAGWTSSPWLASFGLYGALLVAAGLVWSAARAS